MTRLLSSFRTALVAVSVLIVTVASHAQVGVSGTPIEVPAQVTCTNMELMKQVPCPDSTLFFEAGQSLVQRGFNAKDFVALDDLFTQWCTGKDRFPDGRWKLAEYGAGLAVNFKAWNKWDVDLRTITEWEKARPESAAARFAEAVYWHSYAWRARGAGFASTVAKEGWELFRERLGKAEAALASPRLAAANCPATEALRLNLLIEQGASPQQIEATYAKAARQHPEYHGIHFAMARHNEPKWGGSPARYEAFANRAAEMTRKFEGMGMYARIYWLVDYRQGLPFVNDPNTPPSWKKLKAGYDDLMQRYPSSIHNLGQYANVACRSTDGMLYRSLRTKLAGHEQSADMYDPVDVCDRRHRWKSDGRAGSAAK